MTGRGPPVIVIRRARPADAAALLALYPALWADDDGEPEALAVLLGRDDFAAFFALDGAVTVGFAEASLRHYVDGAPDGVNGFLEGLFVVASHRRHRIAARLVNAVAAWARAGGATHLGSDTDADNAIGEGWHRAAGFDEVGRTINFVRPL